MSLQRKDPKDEWGTSTHEGYEDRSGYQPRRVSTKRQGSGFLRSLGSLLIVGGLFWGVYLFTSTSDIEALRRNHGPALLCGLGVIASLLGKYVRL
jgi:hypothetical protein